MGLRQGFNRRLRNATGYELRKVGGRVQRRKRGASEPGSRLLVAPVFVMCSVRSGSTLLRLLLDSHSKIHAPPELHLRDYAVRVKTEYAERALGEIGLDPEQLRFLLWDRLLHRELVGARKQILVNKTPNDVFIADLIARCWPDARFIYLLRHPGAIERSRQATRPQDSPERNARMVLRYGRAVQAARAQRPGLELRYEQLTQDPAGETKRLCEYLGVAWEPEMLDYGSQDHGKLRPGLGDWKTKIKSGSVQAGDPPPAIEQVHPLLHELCTTWGYGAPAPIAA